ncbi:cell division transport system permease protein [Mangrovibacterium marinum]|uniref:Cell division protein FtsX n=1 Tax=Mangrovibacterium marinum TaxID=1639118 RepID=A0A2T5C6A3_9BACT|nr:permease-like cell division protein FtsX [Mangrovibacterium marinum]PTN10478.1 cell division transport system permease protein [Mangrovibacterium marinum]
MRKKRPSKLKRRLFRSYLTVTISISLILFMVGLLSLLVLNAGRLTDYVREHVGFTLVLQENLRDAEVLRLQKILSASAAVKSTEYINKEDAAESLADDMGEDFVDFLGFNPLFSSIDLKLHAPYMQEDSLLVLENEFLAYPQVREVYYQRDLVKVINNNVRRISLFLLVLVFLMLFICTALINNTIRISIYSQRFVINTMKLVGATRSYIRRPFVVRTVSYGLLGGLLANFVIWALVLTFYDSLQNFVDTNQIDALGITFVVTLLSGLIISWLSTYFAVNKYLRMSYNELF